jgi:hypothetical protein
MPKSGHHLHQCTGARAVLGQPGWQHDSGDSEDHHDAPAQDLEMLKPATAKPLFFDVSTGSVLQGEHQVCCTYY